MNNYGVLPAKLVFRRGLTHKFIRRLAQDLTYPLITNLQLECNRDTCPEMKAGEWLYLCVAHGNAPGGHVQVGEPRRNFAFKTNK